MSMEFSAPSGFIFLHFDSTDIRNVMHESQAYVVGKDLCEYLEISKYRDVLEYNLDADEKALLKVDTPGGKQTMVVLNEFGVYKLCLRSNHPNAKRLQRLIIHEVMPSIARYGCYPPPPTEQSTALTTTSAPNGIERWKRIDDLTRHVANVVRRLPALTDRNQQTLTIARVVKTELNEDLLAAVGQTHLICETNAKHYSLTELGKMLNPVMSAVALNKLLEAQDWQTSSRDAKNNLVWTPTEKAKGHYIWTDTGKSHATNGAAPIQQLRWYESILGELILPPVKGGS